MKIGKIIIIFVGIVVLGVAYYFWMDEKYCNNPPKNITQDCGPLFECRIRAGVRTGEMLAGACKYINSPLTWDDRAM